MIEYKNECVGCPQGCLGRACRRPVTRYLVCDWCKEDVTALYEWQDDQVCMSCITTYIKNHMEVNHESN